MKDLREYIEQVIAKREEESLFYWCEGKEIYSKNYNEFYQDILKAAKYLLDKGLYGKNIGVLGANSYELLSCIFGVIYAGNTAVLLPNDNTGVVKLVQKADVELLIVSDELDEYNQEMIHELEDITIKMSDMLNADGTALRAMNIEVTSSTAMIIFTSGTTGSPKGVCLSHENIMSMFYKTVGSLEENAMKGMGWLIALPFHHVSVISLFHLIYLRNDIYLLKSPKYFFKSMQKLNPTAVAVVPSFVEMIYKQLQKGEEKYIGSKLKLVGCGGASLPMEYVEVLNKYNIVVTQGYGMTEASGSIANCACTVEKLGTAGRIVDKQSLSVEDGEIVLSGSFIMEGYYKDEQATREVIKDGKLYTGDLGYIDEDGYLFITGRKKNLIILTNGENISPEELEQALYACPAIDEVVVYEDNNKICAQIYTESKEEESRLQIEEYVKEYNQTVPTFKRIQAVNYRQTGFARNAMGKIIRNS